MLRNPWIYITEACNLRCSYCFNPDEIFTNHRSLTFEDGKRILENIKLYSDYNEKTPIQLTLFGGEPTL
ncbi:radical SAM protein [Marispirochaeta sp.]|uniref:radical SAM protein n=1 Tax=Marispirochaeta sp. TaxID=2038653 RepID=UPI00374A85CF